MAAFELVIKDAKLNKETICEKLKKPQQPSCPLADRLDNAQRRRDEKLNEKKEKAAVDLANKQKKVREQEEELKVKTEKLVTERIKSADSKRKSIVDEKVAKAQAEVIKAKKVAALKKEEAEELAEKNKKIEEKVKAAEEKRAKILEAERQRLREKHEKAKLVPLNKKKVDPSPEE